MAFMCLSGNKCTIHTTAAVGYATRDIQQFELELHRPHGSPTKKLLWDWGSRGGTIRELYDKLAQINKTQSMRLLENIMRQDSERAQAQSEYEKKMDNSAASIESKSDNYSMYRGMESMAYNPEILPIPSMKRENMDINLNMPDSQDKARTKAMGMFDMSPGSKAMGMFDMSPGATSPCVVQVCMADSPMKSNMGAASPAMPSFERVKSVVEDGARSPHMCDLSLEEREMAQALLSVPAYTYKELSQATDGFSASRKLGQGKYGVVYMGTVKNTKCAVKKLIRQKQDEAMAYHMCSELKALSRYHHENLVTLYGYALDNDEVCLVYQYLVNGSLHDNLHLKKSPVLSWERRVSILKGAACGLQFLHSVDKKPVIHGDIKSSNILLDQYYEAKIGDLGLAQQATGGEVTGKMTHITKKNTSAQDYTNMAYYAPEIKRGNVFSVKGDTYAFGVVMYEVLTGEPAYDDRKEGAVGDKYLASYIENALEESPDMDVQKCFQDRKLKEGFPSDTFQTLFQLAGKCVKTLKKDRPSMVEVFTEIEPCVLPDYVNIQDLKTKNDSVDQETKVGQDCKNVDSSLPLNVSFTSQGSMGSNLKAPPEPPRPVGNQLKSPVDLLPKNQPIPEAFRLQIELDKKKEKLAHYENIGKVADNFEKCSLEEGMYKSDTKKLAEIERSDREFDCQKVKTEKSYVLETGDFNIQKQQFLVLKDSNHGHVLHVDEKLLESEQQVAFVKNASLKDSHDYVNIPQTVNSLLEKDAQENKDSLYSGEGQKPVEHDDNTIESALSSLSGACSLPCPEPDPVDNINRELNEITKKAKNLNNFLPGLFDTFDWAKKEQNLNNTEGYDEMDLDEEFEFQFGETVDSDQSTLMNSDHEAYNSQDIDDDDLFTSVGPSYENVPGKISNCETKNNIDKHRDRLNVYQEMAIEYENDENDDDLQERAVHNNTDEPCGENQNSEDNSIKSVHLPEHFPFKKQPSSKLADFPKSQIGKVQGGAEHNIGAGQGHVNSSMIQYLQKSQIRVASEGDCPEYV
ncbi:uncharacterized protein LOC127832334 isoform X2 [Dreissena polymorpha]|uniref:uncharacterized protein LOC127832334 isoform X2 n=1 Tax=Dreissena polymorpha TaxID=45954 RepID=UPI00226543C9|nr:uncharacterized protein LOC127832334 isoform X2 [Dreissena polymorpha]